MVVAPLVEGFEIDVILHYSEGEDAWRSLAEQWKQAGATHFSMRSMDTGVALTGEKPAGLKTVQDQIGALMGQGTGTRSADAAAATSDDRCFAFKFQIHEDALLDPV